MKRLFEVKDLTVEFRQKSGSLIAVNHISYHLDKGEIVAFVGESGSGKSVTQYTGLQLVPCPPGHITSGEIWFEGKNILEYGANSEEMRRIRGGQIGVIFQEPMTSLNPVMTIGKQITESICLHLGLSKKDALKRAAELLEKVGLPDVNERLNAYPHQLSGGMRQRVMIAMALSCNPKILIADEATTALDVTTQAQILELMKEIVKEMGTTLVIVTHNLSLVARYADRVYVMYAGEIVETGTTEELFYKTKHPYSIGLLQAIPSLTDPRDRKLIPIRGTVGDLRNRDGHCVFMPRCPYATEECGQLKAPTLTSVDESSTHMRACHKNISLSDKIHPDDNEMRVEKTLNREEGKPLLKVEDLSVVFPIYRGIMRKQIGQVSAVNHVSFEVFKGETFGLVGESGCGKTTVARAIIRLEDITEGKIMFEGQDISHMNEKNLRPFRRNMSMIFQDPYGSLDPRQRVGEAVKEPLVNFKLGYTEKELDERVNELFTMVGLDPSYRDRLPHEFSGGQRQRIVIARALATNPSLILCDEAISALDVSIQAQVINLLEELQDRLGITYLFIAHDLSVVRHISDRIAVMYLGQIVEMGDWKELYENPRHPYTRTLLDAVPVPDPVIEKNRKARQIEGEVPSPMNRPSGCAFSTRCPYATQRCYTELPALEDLGMQHFAACFRLHDSILNDNTKRG